MAAKAAFEGDTGKMVIIERLSDEPYLVQYKRYDIHEIANVERKVPKTWITEKNNFKNWKMK